MNDRGSATVCGVAVLAVFLLLLAFGARFGAAVIARHRVASAADLAALAAAVHLPSGQARACDRARWVAEQMRARVDECSTDGWEVTVELSASTEFGTASARARAGPAEE